jgi:hypothetical protein
MGVRSNIFIIVTTMSIPSSVQEAYIVSIYMKQKLPHVLLERSVGDMEQPESPYVEIQHPLNWSVEFAMEVDLALDVIARAFRNQGIFSATPSQHILLI